MNTRTRKYSCRFLVSLLVLAACGPSADRADVLVITVDTLRADRLGCYGHASAQTPHIDRLAAEGTRYLECQAPTPVTLPSHATLFTGLLPPEHGVRNNVTYRLPAGTATLASELQQTGYATAAFVAAFPVAARFGLDQGFDHYDDALPAAGDQPFHFAQRSAPSVVEAALRWVEMQPGDRPLFVWVHLFEPHMPYDLVPPFDLQFASAPYDGEVAAADAAVGDLLRGWDAARGADRLTVLTSDHGEGLGEHDEASHSIFLYQSTLRVPLIVHWPGVVPAGRDVHTPVGLVDLAPTVLAALEVDAQQLVSPHGRALVPVGEESSPGRQYSESLVGLEAFGWSPLFALRRGSEKVVRSRRSLAFDLATDPGELRDLRSASPAPAWTDSLLGDLDEMITTTRRRDPIAPSVSTPTPAELAALGALGYVGGTAPAEETSLLAATRDRPDATDRIDEFNRISQAEMFLARQQAEPALRLLDEVVEQNPENDWARQRRAQALRDAGRMAEAAVEYSHVADRQPRWSDVRIDLARVHRDLGEFELASARYLEAARLDPQNVAWVTEAANFLQGTGKFEGAAQLLESSLREESVPPAGRAELHGGLARVYYQMQRLELGEPHLRRARELGDDPSLVVVQALYHRVHGRWEELVRLLELTEGELTGNAEALTLRGLGLHMLGRAEESARRYREALTLNDRLDLAHQGLARVLALELNQPEEALAHSQAALRLAPRNPDVHVTHLEVLRRAGREEIARRHVAQALEIFPNHLALRTQAAALGVQ